ncbi:MAG: hypothetical protein ABIQ30_01175 [Devosia sp.]
MASSAERRVSVLVPARQVNWRGRSGRFYALTPERIDTLALTTSGLYLLARGGVPMWVGSAHDVIHDASSRSRFRLALEAADRAFLVDAEGDELSRMTLVWDLEGAEPVTGLNAA